MSDNKKTLLWIVGFFLIGYISYVLIPVNPILEVNKEAYMKQIYQKAAIHLAVLFLCAFIAFRITKSWFVAVLTIACLGYWGILNFYYPSLFGVSRGYWVQVWLLIAAGWYFIKDENIRLFWISLVILTYFQMNRYYILTLYRSYAVYLGLFLFVAKYVDSREVFDFVCIFTLINVIYAWLQRFGIDFMYVTAKIVAVCDTTKPVVVGMMGNPNHLAALIGFSVPCFMRGKLKWLLLFTIPILFLQHNMVSHTRGGVILVLFAFSYFCFLFLKRKYGNRLAVVVLIVFAVLGISGLFTVSQKLWGKPFLETGRISWIIKLVGKMNIKDFIIGNGIGSFFQGKPIGDTLWRLHNEYIELLWCVGIVPLIFAARYLWQTIYRYLKYYMRLESPDFDIVFCGICLLAINCITNFTFHVDPLAVIGMCYLGIFEGLKREYEHKESQLIEKMKSSAK